jgi:hypothetical protein
MRLTKTSQQLLTYFVDHPFVPNIELDDPQPVLYMYHLLQNAIHHLANTKPFVSFHMNRIESLNQIPLPKTFSRDSFPKEVIQHIHSHSQFHLQYSFSLEKRKIQIHFVVEDHDIERKLPLYQEYVEKIMIWLYIVQQVASPYCSKELHLFIYHTSLQKWLPDSTHVVLDQIHVNTAFTYVCNPVSEIVVFRKEEWFKVLMHETFHNFALDFSNMNDSAMDDRIRKLFHVQTDVNLFESYTEFWARLWNAVFCSFFLMKRGEKEKDFLFHFDSFVRTEIIFAFFQMVKILHFMGIQYKDIIREKSNKYKENTNVLAYFVLTLVLLSHYNDFLSWCKKHNPLFFAFQKTNQNLHLFCDFIEKKYRDKIMLNGVKSMETFFSSNMLSPHLRKNMRMTVTELG